MLAISEPRSRKRASLTPMIDVVFLLLVFFMLASQFGVDRVLSLGASGTESNYSGPPRLVVIKPEGVFLNGVRVDLDALPNAVSPLMQAKDDAIVLKPDLQVPLQALMDVAGTLTQDGFTTLMVME